MSHRPTTSSKPLGAARPSQRRRLSQRRATRAKTSRPHSALAARRLDENQKSRPRPPTPRPIQSVFRHQIPAAQVQLRRARPCRTIWPSRLMDRSALSEVAPAARPARGRSRRGGRRCWLSVSSRGTAGHGRKLSEGWRNVDLASKGKGQVHANQSSAHRERRPRPASIE